MTSKQKEEVFVSSSATIYDVLRKRGLNPSKKNKMIIGKLVLVEWLKKSKDIPIQIEQKEGNNIFTVNQYPSWFIPKINRIISEFCKKRQENKRISNLTVI